MLKAICKGELVSQTTHTDMDMDGNKPKVGDKLEIFRSGYHHWAIYVGDGKIINVIPPAGGSIFDSILSGKAVVQEQKLEEMTGDDEWRVNNDLDEKYKPRPADKIKRLAYKNLDLVVDYSVIWNNCEHFANRVRYGKSISLQSDAAVAKIEDGGNAAAKAAAFLAVERAFYKGDEEDEDEAVCE